jgi:hypothetical protein
MIVRESRQGRTGTTGSTGTDSPASREGKMGLCMYRGRVELTPFFPLSPPMA